MALDLNRGVMTKFHPSGIKVNMYLDDPGTYLDDRGQPLDEKFAIQAGFNVERDKREKLKQLKLKAYKEQLDREMRSEEEALAEAMSQSGNVDVRHIGGGQFAIFDKTGARAKNMHRRRKSHRGCRTAQATPTLPRPSNRVLVAQAMGRASGDRGSPFFVGAVTC